MDKTYYKFSTKDLLYFEDLLAHILVLIKKLKLLDSHSSNSTVKSLISEVKKSLQSQYDELIDAMEVC